MSSLLPKRYIRTRTVLPASRGMMMILVVVIASSTWTLCDTTNKALVVLVSLFMGILKGLALTLKCILR